MGALLDILLALSLAYFGTQCVFALVGLFVWLL